MQTSTSSGDQFANAIRTADPRSRARIDAPKSDIQHGHENDGDPMKELPPRWAEQAEQTGLPSALIPGMPRNADGTKRDS